MGGDRQRRLQAAGAVQQRHAEHAHADLVFLVDDAEALLRHPLQFFLQARHVGLRIGRERARRVACEVGVQLRLVQRRQPDPPTGGAVHRHPRAGTDRQRGDVAVAAAHHVDDLVAIARAHRDMLLGLPRHLLDDRPQHARQLRGVHVGLADAQRLGRQPVVAVVGLGEAFVHQGQQETPRGARRHPGQFRRLRHAQARLVGAEQLHQRQALLQAGDQVAGVDVGFVHGFHSQEGAVPPMGFSRAWPAPTGGNSID
ncbi:hypothetical protein FQZ97_584180 [compost metagenome]